MGKKLFNWNGYFIYLTHYKPNQFFIFSKQLPKWGYEQQEVACNPTTRDPNSMWNVEDNFYPRLPNVSFQNFAPGFVAKFIESHAVMLQGNAGLKPKEGEYTSRPWEWPINIKVGTYFIFNFIQHLLTRHQLYVLIVRQCPCEPLLLRLHFA